ncbi:MAG: MBL fold metallo-hydrolase [Alphaproteobacteria bacterium]|nr:MBL fold metallo-hydrolase [Alphaproteobacteria bacterium]MBU1550557.1 MBL fold metallo-hydrolase [Alphaproteobacteria bacterium]MBU2338693.1 MBL fold metallo-hydrolase [Alphaproteobacteria bacterium]MBU2386784.1 MBL fold metallo-hydrolase [Alphaproteobacteria bacterium]
MVDTSTLRVFEPYPGVFAYYDGRIAGKRLYSQKPNWLDDGAFELGAASYAIVDGAEALVYDTHISIAHARFIRQHLEDRGVGKITVVLSHWHADHVAGNAVFEDCEIIALELTARALEENRPRLESRDPPIRPLVMPNRLFTTALTLQIGERTVELHHFDIHSADGNILWLADQGLLFAGDTLEDPISYLAEADRLAVHIRELERMRSWPIRRILPNHGSAERIAAGGYSVGLIDANRRYLEKLTTKGELSKPEIMSLKDFIAEDLAAGAIDYFKPYEAVHRRNVVAIMSRSDGD